MKRFLTTMMALSALIASVSSCKKDGPDTPAEKNAPQLVWEKNPDFAVTELKETMDVNMVIEAEAGIKSFVVKVNSGVLNPLIGKLNGGSLDMDLISGSEKLLSLLSTVRVPVKDQLLNKTSVDFSLSALVPKIITTAGNDVLGMGKLENDSDHTFTLSVTDNDGKSFSQNVVFHYTGTSPISVEADLWNYSASVTVSLAGKPEAVKLFYKEKNASDWIEIPAKDGKYGISTPESAWTASRNAAGLDIKTLTGTPAITGGKTYVFELRDGSTVLASEEISTNADVIPNGDMSGWSKVSRAGLAGSKEVDYPNASATDNLFWDCGNNGVTTALCVPDQNKFGAAAPAAAMTSKFMLVLAAGNLFTGDFNYANMTGTVKFGRKYAWTARPKALKLKYNAIVGDVDNVRSQSDADSDMIPEQLAKGDPDKARIFVAIVDWRKQQEVVSDMTKTKGSWNPETQTEIEGTGKILGYGSLVIPKSQSGTEEDPLKDASIDINWYDTSVKPAEGNYSIVISCACNFYGDFFTGCSKNKLWVDDFEWVY